MSWKAILAGTVASAALTLVLVAFGVGVGFSVISPWNGSGISASTFTIGAGIYLIVIAMLSSTIGGYLAGRLRSKWPSVHEHERYFRDSAHGLLVWALATVVTAVFLGGAMTAIVGGAGVAATSAAASPMAATYVDQLMRTAPNRAANTAAAAPSSTQAAQQGAQQTTEQATSPSAVGQNPPALQGGQISSPATQGGARVNRGEITRIVAPALVKGGSLSDLNRAYLVQVVAERNGMTNAQAEQRVDEVLAQAKQAADKARKSTAAFAFWLTFAMLAGALSAALAAIEGGHLRNREWYLTEAKGQRVTAAK
ncbi:MAG TPA: hypothetical protein VFC54_03760 [Pseudolabrys sp.]|nr:hypothetical protein [Pseudolabrys sp.]